MYSLVPNSSASLVKHPEQPRKPGCFIPPAHFVVFVTVTDPFLLRLT
jgi:hypothetical protein